jgi:hypothetical protein
MDTRDLLQEELGSTMASVTSSEDVVSFKNHGGEVHYTEMGEYETQPSTATQMRTPHPLKIDKFNVPSGGAHGTKEAPQSCATHTTGNDRRLHPNN